MGRRKLGFTSLFFRVGDTTRSSSSSFSSYIPSSSSWAWPSCKDPRTDTFRVTDADEVYKTVNSVYFDSTDSCFTHSSEEYSESFSTGSDVDDSEMVIRGLMRSDRLFFEPGGDTRSILEEAYKVDEGFPFKESTVMAMESEDPYHDFRKSMEEMVVAHGMKDWDCLEELLVWYLRMNVKKTHGFIVGAFVDLLVGLSSPPDPDHLPSSSSSLSSISFEIEEVDEGSG